MQDKAKLSDLVLPLVVVAVIGMMIFPLPLGMLDLLLMLNIAFALVLLLSSVYLAQPERFTSLPSILLLATLFRLGLNISTTRQILSTGTAPGVVLGFGTFAAGGNLIVGAVIFAIITLVQFLVIAKGAERVAEVAARFTLDAMPGKQMSIDADVRSGLLSLIEAREKRVDLQRESKLYGSLDGAMKFVKGDAIAGLLITVINIVAGLLIGVTQHKLSLGSAVERYTLFTIGDGLVSQIPALLVAVAAGITVTRVEDKCSKLIGRDMLVQLTREPQAIATAGVVILFMAFLPGLPLLPYLIMGMLLSGGSYVLKRRNEEAVKAVEQAAYRPKVLRGITFKLSPELVLALQEEQTLPARIQGVRQNIFERRGVFIQDIQFEIDPSKKGSSGSIHLNGVEIKNIVIDYNNTEAERRGEGVGSDIAARVGTVIEAHLSDLVDDTQTRILLEVHREAAEDLINSVVPEMIGVTALTGILRQLVEEKVSIRDMGTILQAVAEYRINQGCAEERPSEAIDPAEKPPFSGGQAMDLLTVVRTALRRSISREACQEGWVMKAYVLDLVLDRHLSQSFFTCSPIDSTVCDQIVKEARAKVQQDTGENSLVLIASQTARKKLADVLASGVEGASVLSYSEISEEVKLECLGRFGENIAPEEESQTVNENQGGEDESVEPYPAFFGQEAA